MGVPDRGPDPHHNTVTARCAAAAGCELVYESSPIKGAHHLGNARAKAVRLAQAHAAAKNHPVHVADGRTVAVVACRCAECGKATPGYAFGICEACLFRRVA
jgi:hypothetical protein